MLQNAYFLAKIGADTAENEQHFAEILPIGRRVADRCRRLLAGARQLLPPPLLRGGGEARGIREVLRNLRATGSRQAVQRPRVFSSQAGRFESFFMLY